MESTIENNQTDANSSQIIISLDEIIINTKNSTSSQELENAMVAVKPGIGSCTTRRTLRRLLEQKLKDPVIQTQVNAKSRRRFQRILQILKPDAELGHKQEEEKKALQIKAKESESKKVKEVKEVQAPCVLFIGQLTFDTTADDIEAYLRTNGVNGEITVRLRNDSNSQQSLGMGFVEVEGPRELRKALTLHHSFLNGRRINIEKSCGGRSKDARRQKIDSIRTELQQQNDAAVEELLTEYSDRGIVDVDRVSEKVMHVIMSTNPTVLKNVFQQYASLDEESRTHDELDRLLYVWRRKQARHSYMKDNIESRNNSHANMTVDDSHDDAASMGSSNHEGNEDGSRRKKQKISGVAES